MLKAALVTSLLIIGACGRMSIIGSESKAPNEGAISGGKSISETNGMDGSVDHQVFDRETIGKDSQTAPTDSGNTGVAPRPGKGVISHQH